MACVGTCAISGLAFGAGGTLVNRAGSNDVIVQTGKEKNVPTSTSLHLADGQVHGLPMVGKPVETVKNLPLPEQTSGQNVNEPQGLPAVDSANVGEYNAIKKEEEASVNGKADDRDGKAGTNGNQNRQALRTDGGRNRGPATAYKRESA